MLWFTANGPLGAVTVTGNILFCHGARFPCHFAFPGGAYKQKATTHPGCGFYNRLETEKLLGPGFEAVGKFILWLIELDLLHRACAIATGLDVRGKPSGFVRRKIHPAFFGGNRIAGA